MEKTIVLMGKIFGMKKMDFSKVEHADIEILNQSKDTLKVNQINNPELKHLLSIEQNLKNIWNEMK